MPGCPTTQPRGWTINRAPNGTANGRDGDQVKLEAANGPQLVPPPPPPFPSAISLMLTLTIFSTNFFPVQPATSQSCGAAVFVMLPSFTARVLTWRHEGYLVASLQATEQRIPTLRELTMCPFGIGVQDPIPIILDRLCAGVTSVSAAIATAKIRMCTKITRAT